ncbi:hypothetical protein FE633_23560 [Streptomyces montanus]|uniref:VOC domain-containing protein n=1 Tax=Streptomyces montanus TaxID=2580423 RepID=A0A5R9FMF0_9ACTN|nr:VOC family protein [Streptomyces montanus]TLS43779.1 hypothetical protein FE633_23560 [Streptomyces montanus]
MITNSRLALLCVPDQERAAKFLTGALGCELVVDVPVGDGRRWVEVRPPGARTCLVLAAVDKNVLEALHAQAGRMAHGWFDCDDLDATCADLRAKGVRIVVEPEPARWREGSRWAQIADPDGNLYGLTERGR